MLSMNTSCAVVQLAAK